MANEISVTAAQVGVVDPEKSIIKDYIAGATVTKGQPVSQTTDGTVDPSDASSGGGYLFEQFRGIALNGGGAGQSISVLESGEVYGFDLSGMDITAAAYLSNTAGSLSTVVGDVTVYVGKVVCLTDKDATKVLRVQVIWAEAVPA